MQVVLPNDANPLTVSWAVRDAIDIAGAIAAHRHTGTLLATAADGLQFLHPIKVGDLLLPCG